jgi:hypothetical protein
MSAKPTPTARRAAFIEAVQEPIVEALAKRPVRDDDPLWVEVAERIATEGPALGRTEKWQTACAFFAQEQHGSWGWTVRQGIVWLCYANV